MTEPLFCEVCDCDHRIAPRLVLARWRDQDICTDCLAEFPEMEAAEVQEEEAPVPDRLASQIVYAVLDTMVQYGFMVRIYSDINITAMNNATDMAIEEVEKLLRQD